MIFQSLSGSLNSDDFDSDFFDSEDDASQRETDGGDGDSSEDDELHGSCLFSFESLGFIFFLGFSV